MPPQLVGNLQDDEAIRPGGEPTVPAEAVQLGEDRDHRVIRRLIRQVGQLGSADAEHRATSMGLMQRDSEQESMQPREGLIARTADCAQRVHPGGGFHVHSSSPLQSVAAVHGWWVLTLTERYRPFSTTTRWHSIRQTVQVCSRTLDASVLLR